MDDISRCKNQLNSFRIKELKDVLSRLGLPKQGKKQVLMDKIMAVLIPSEWQQQHSQKVKSGSLRSSVSREEAAKVIDDIYRKLRGLGSAVELASLPRNVSAVSLSATRSEEQEDTVTWELRCPCGSSLDSGTSIQCENQACNIWQHLSCVVIPEKIVEGVEPEVPSQFYCEMCRINYGDPFCVTLSQPLYPAKFFAPQSLAMEGTSPLHSLEKTFSLSKSDREVLHKPNHDLQVWCLLLNDKVPFRMHWPAYADLRINGVSVRVTTRAGTQLLGANGRDDGHGIFNLTREGTNRISLQACDARAFCIGVRIIRRLSVDQVMSSIPSVSVGEPLEEALSRVKRCINGGAGDAGGDDDSDLEVVADSVTVNLSCPMSGSRINVAGRFKPCLHMGGFDLRTFVELNQRTRKWQCPVCMKNYSLEQIIIDPFFNRIAHAMKGFGEDVKEIELKADGFWRPKLEGDARFKEPWRNPDGSFVLANGTTHKTSVKLEEGVSQERRSLKIGMKRAHDGTWAVNKIKNSPWSTKEVPKAMEPSFSRSSSATDSNNEDDDRSVNQDPYANEYTADNEAGLYNLPINAWKKNKSSIATTTTPIVPEAATAAAANGNGAGGDLIVVSDSDEESGSPGGTFNFRKPRTGRTTPASFVSEGTGIHKDRLANGGHTSSSRHTSEGGIGLPVENSSYWSQHQQPPYRFFESSPAENSDYGLRSDKELDYSRRSAYMEEEENTGASKSGFRLFLPAEPAREEPQTITQGGHREEVPDDNWFSLSLGGGGGGGGVNPPSHEYSRPGRGERLELDSVARTASVLLGLNNSNINLNLNNSNHNNRSVGHSRRNHSSRQQQQQARRIEESEESE